MDSDVWASGSVIASQRVGAKRRPMIDSANQIQLSRSQQLDCFVASAPRNDGGALKPYGHPDMAGGKPQPLVEALRIGPRVVREQLDQSAAFRSRLRDGPLHQLLADAAAAVMRGD